MIKEDAEEEGFNCMENSAVFAVSMFQYIGMALVFAKGEPFRKHPFTNGILLFLLLHMYLGGSSFSSICMFFGFYKYCLVFF